MNESISKEEEEIEYYVVVNHKEQYSIWPAYKPMPNGWKSVGNFRSKEECLNYINEVWIDMRPLSLREKTKELEIDN